MAKRHFPFRFPCIRLSRAFAGIPGDPTGTCHGFPHRAGERERFARGFTLLEIMLVLVLLGLVTSAILPSLIPKDSGALLKQEARRLVMLAQTAREQALITGQDMGLRQTSEGYQFLVYQQGQWHTGSGNKLLSSVELDDAIDLAILPGESVWRHSLEQEKDQGFLSDKTAADDNESENIIPDLYFWSSGENSPAELQFLSASNGRQHQSVFIRESGAVVLASEDRQ